MLVTKKVGNTEKHMQTTKQYVHNIKIEKSSKFYKIVNKEEIMVNSRLDEIYCDYQKENGKTCREQEAIQAYNERLKQNKALAEYRRLYQLKFKEKSYERNKR